MTFQNEEDFRRWVAQGLHERLAQKCVVLDSKNVIALWTEGPRELLQHADWIQRETLAVELRVDGGDLQIARA